jgi:DNA-binding response OmpR family regulator
MQAASQSAFTEQAGVLGRFIGGGAGMGFAPETVEASYRVLIVERSTALARLLATGLAAERLLVDTADSIEVAVGYLENEEYQLVILGMDMGRVEDVEALSHLQLVRSLCPNARVLALGGQSGVDGLVSALDNGADDYLVKPFSLLEMLARVRALRRRVGVSAAPARKSSALVLHRDQCRVERDGRSIDLTPREFALLDVLMENAGKTLSRAALTQQVWNMSAEANTNIVDVYVKYLRDKIDGDHEQKLIRTVRGMGYLFQAA